MYLLQPTAYAVEELVYSTKLLPSIYRKRSNKELYLPKITVITTDMLKTIAIYNY